MDTQRGTGICELELRKQDVTGEQWSRAVLEDTGVLEELDLQHPSLLDPWPQSLEAAGPARPPRPSLLILFLSSQCLPTHHHHQKQEKIVTLLSDVSSAIFGGN